MASGETLNAAIPPHLVEALGLSVVAPFTLMLEGDSRTFAALVREFGAPGGMITDPLWSNLEPFADALLTLGFGYSCVDLSNADQASLIDILFDWGWCGLAAARPSWLDARGDDV